MIFSISTSTFSVICNLGVSPKNYCGWGSIFFVGWKLVDFYLFLGRGATFIGHFLEAHACLCLYLGLSVRLPVSLFQLAYKEVFLTIVT